LSSNKVLVLEHFLLLVSEQFFARIRARLQACRTRRSLKGPFRGGSALFSILQLRMATVPGCKAGVHSAAKFRANAGTAAKAGAWGSALRHA